MLNKYLNTYNLILLITFIVAFLIRFINLGYDSIRLDESQSIWQASHSIQYIIEYMSKNVHLPLYNIVLHYFIKLFGFQEGVLRLTAAIPGFISVIFFYLFAKEAFNKKVALIAAVFASVSPIWVWYSREIRMYGLLLLATTASLYFFVKYLNTNKKLFLALYTIVNILGIYTHYFFALNLISQAVYFLLIYKSSSKKTIFFTLLASALVILVALFPWILKLLDSTGVGKFGPSLDVPTGSSIIATYFEFLTGYQALEVGTNLAAFWPLFMLLVLLLIKSKNSKYLPLLFISCFLPVMLLFLGSQVYKPMYLTRYVIVIVPSFIAILAYVVSLLNKNLRVFATLGMVLILTLSLRTQQLSPNNPYKENYKQAVLYIQSKTNVRDIVAVAPAYTIYPVSYYYNDNTTITTLPIWDKKKGGIPTLTVELLEKDISELKDGNSRLFYLATTNLEDSMEIKEYLDNKYTKLEKREFSENIQLNVYKLEYKNEISTSNFTQ